MEYRIEALGPDDVPGILDVFCDAFSGYPVMQYVLGRGGDHPSRLRQLIGYFVLRRVRLGGPMLGARAADGTLAGVATMTAPVESVAPPDLLATRDRVFRALGPGCAARYDSYAEAARFFGSVGPHHHLNMLGVRRAYHGQRVGRMLLTAVAELANGDQSSSGVSLTTETAENVRLYEHCGYKVVGEARVADSFHTWGLFQPRRAMPT
jgi:GNAT superfamily N-acetyltransferase